MNSFLYELLFLEEANEFLYNIPLKARKKIAYNIYKVLGGVKDADLFKKLEGTDIWEFRTLYEGMTYRLFSFWDTEQNAIIVATHGLVKKSQKTPLKEIEKAERIRKEYFNSKRK